MHTHRFDKYVSALPSLVCGSMENQDRKFDQMLSLQALDKSKAIAHILQEVRGVVSNLFLFHICVVMGAWWTC